MEGPLGVLMSGFALVMVPEQISSYVIQPEVHQHYVDVYFDIAENENQDPFLVKNLNSIVPELQFTNQTDIIEGSLSF